MSNSESDSDVCDFSSNFDEVIKRKMEKFSADSIKDLGSDSPIISKRKRRRSSIEFDDEKEEDLSLCSDDEKINDSLVNDSTSSSDEENNDCSIINGDDGDAMSSNNEETNEFDAEAIKEKLQQLENMANRIRGVTCKKVKKSVSVRRSQRSRVQVQRHTVQVQRNRWQVQRNTEQIQGSKRITRSCTRVETQKPIETIIIPDTEPEKTEDVDLIKINEQNPMMTVTIEWQFCNKKTFNVKKFQSLNTIVDFYSQENKVDPSRLLFTLNNREIDLVNNCYLSLNLNENSIIEGMLIAENTDRQRIAPFLQKEFKIKVQNVNQRQDFYTYLKDENCKMEMVFWEIIQKFNIDFEKIKIQFDGYIVKPSDTPNSLDLENGDCIDVIIS